MSSLSVAENNNNDLEGGNHLSEALLPKTMTTTTTAAAKTNSPSSKPKQTIAKKKKEKNHKYDSEILERNKRAAIQLMAIWLITLSGLIYNYYFNNNNNKTIMNEFSFEIKTPAVAPDPLDNTVLFPDDTEDTSMIVARWPDDDDDEAEQVAASSSSSLNGPIPPFHPHHTAFVTYSSHMSSKGSVEYRRDIRVPCNYGMLVFSVGLAKDNLPYRYEVYNDAYLFSDNNSLCILNPWYTGYQVSNEPFWNPTDPMSLEVKNLNKDTMHWISSRLVNPYSSKRKYDRQKTGDYIVVAKHNFYDAHYYQALKAAVNQWQ